MKHRWQSPVDASAPHRFAPWVRALVYENGVYAIRGAEDKAVLYVGESHIRRLYDTLTRHLQHWSGRNAGPSYERAFVEVKVETTKQHTSSCPLLVPNGGRHCKCGAAQAAVNLQDDWILRLIPRDNRQRPLEEVPF